MGSVGLQGASANCAMLDEDSERRKGEAMLEGRGKVLE